MQCACAILSSVPCPALQYFPTLSHKRHDFRGEKKLLNTKCVFLFSLQLLSETFLILRIFNFEFILHKKCSLLEYSRKTLEFSSDKELRFILRVIYINVL